MRKSIGIVIVLWATSQFFSSSFKALDQTATASLKAIEVAARASQDAFTK